MAADTRDYMYGTNKSILERESSFSRLSTAMVGRAHKLEAADPVNAGSCRALVEEGDHGAKIKATEVSAIAVSTVPSNCQPKRRGMLWEWKSLKECKSCFGLSFTVSVKLAEVSREKEFSRRTRKIGETYRQ
ncbi:unnamed protein product [Ixodes persulcatus]